MAGETPRLQVDERPNELTNRWGCSRALPRLNRSALETRRGTALASYHRTCTSHGERQHEVRMFSMKAAALEPLRTLALVASGACFLGIVARGLWERGTVVRTLPPPKAAQTPAFQPLDDSRAPRHDRPSGYFSARAEGTMTNTPCSNTIARAPTASSPRLPASTRPPRSGQSGAPGRA
jgi:hypothetical protein